jgi:hypothetical protein
MRRGGRAGKVSSRDAEAAAFRIGSTRTGLAAMTPDLLARAVLDFYAGSTPFSPRGSS